MRFRILGPLEIDAGGEDTALRRPKPRALLALLLLHANRPVSTDTLVSGLWGDDAPPSALGALQNYVSLLRKALGPDVLVTRAPGYMLRLEPDDLDLERFQRLVAEANGLEGAARASRLREALALWRGPPLADIAYEPFAQSEINRLEELGLAALEERLETDLELGRHAELISELEALVREQPLRERLRALQMLALYRSGRQADALAAYQDARRHLGEELGLEPGHELQRLERAILLHDPSLAAAVQADAEPAPPAASRRLVTALVGSLAAAGEHVDPEALRHALMPVLAELRAAVERYGATLRFAGGELTALFGVDVVHEDDALRALTAAQELRSAIAGVNATLDPARRLELRIGIESADAIVETVDGEPEVTTAALVTARRLQDVAAPDETIVGPTVVALARGAVSVERVSADRMRSDGPREAYRLVGLKTATEAVASFDTGLVGRAAELTRLEDELARATADRRCRFIAVVGEAGIGKTRLVRELADRTNDDLRVFVARCASYAHGGTFLPLVDPVRDIAQGTTAEAIAAVLGERDRDVIAQRLVGVLGLVDVAVPTGDAFWAIRRFCESLARERPLLLVIEDAHWAEPTFLDLVDYLREWIRDAPMLVVCTARPEVLDARPAWGAAALVLGPLSDAETDSLVRGLAPVSDDVRREVVATAEGNPLFAEQLVAAAGLGVPGARSIEALLASRLDRLDAGERAVAQRAATLGRAFSRDALAALTPGDELPLLDVRIGSAVRHGLFRRTDDGARFHHGLVRDAAYSSATKALRSELHAEAAEWLGGRGEPDELVGYHLERSFRYREELGLVDDEARAVAHAAGERIGRAGMRAFALGDVRGARGLLTRATQLLPPRDPYRLELLCELGIVQWLTGDAGAARATFHEAEAHATAAEDRRLVLRARIERAHVGLLTDPETLADDVLELATAAIPQLEDLGDDRTLGRAWFLEGFVEGAFRCRNAAWVEALERAIDHYRRAGFPPSSPIGQLGSALFYGPTPVGDAIERIQRLLSDADAGRNGDATLQAFLAGLEAFQGRFGDARALLDHATATFVELGQVMALATACDVMRGEVEMLAGDADAAERALRTCCETLQRLEEWAQLSTHAGSLADVLYEQGQLDDADAWSRLAAEHAEPGDLSAQLTWRSVRGKIRARQGALDEGESLAREALAFAEQTDAINQRAKVLLALAHVLELEGKSEEAAARVDKARGLFDAKGNIVAAERAASRLEQART